MREQLARYVELLFAGTTDTYEIQQEILQNTLDKYDDLTDQGKSPEAAYRLAISGIGDINEILATSEPQQPSPAQPADPSVGSKKLLRAIAIALYILCPVPLFMSDGGTWGLCLMLVVIAIATALIIYAGKNSAAPAAPTVPAENNPKQIARGIIWGAGIPLYISVSFITNAWYITWVLFPLMACIQGLTSAIIDLKEACKHEN